MIRKFLGALALFFAASLLLAGGAAAQYRGYGDTYNGAPDYYDGGPFGGGQYAPYYEPLIPHPPRRQPPPDSTYGEPYGPDPADRGGYGQDGYGYAPDERALPPAPPPRARRAAPQRDLPYADPLNGQDYGPNANLGPEEEVAPHTGPASDADLGDTINRRTRTEVDNPTKQAPGTIVINTAERYLYLVEPNGKAMRYGIGVGREGFAWKGEAHVQRKSEWPDWIPPKDMLKRRPDLPTRMAGGIENPLGARALYLFQGKKDTLFRIHGTNEPKSIGKAVSSGCIRMLNADVIDLYKRVEKGTKVVVE